jgi:diamine N-acetyltransferase
MAEAEQIPGPFGADLWKLTTARGASILLEPIEAASAGPLAEAITAIDPWKRMNYRPDVMAAYLAAREPGTCRRAILHDAKVVGAVSIRHPWLRGPYLELLATLPGSQGLGIGAAVLDWMAREVAGRANSLWVCTSTFNTRALSFYERHGFVRVGDLDELVGPGLTEILLRKQL